jgi:hypothetical protein
VRSVTALDGAGCPPGIVYDAEARAIFEDAAAAHRAAVSLSDGASSYHEEPAATIELIPGAATPCGERAIRPGDRWGRTRPRIVLTCVSRDLVT